MLTQCSNRLNKVETKNQSQSPYYLQYKIFEDRLKYQGNKWKIQKMKQKYHNQVLKAPSTNNKEDYIGLVKRMLEKNQNINLFEEIPNQMELGRTQTAQSLEKQKQKASRAVLKVRHRHNGSRACSDQSKATYRNQDEDIISHAPSNLTFDYPSRVRSIQKNSRIKSEANTAHLILNTNKIYSTGKPERNVSFLGYKRDKRVMEFGCKRVRGIL